MIKNLTIALTMFTLMACGKAPVTVDVDPVLQPYYDSFMNEVEERGFSSNVSLSIHFTPTTLPGNVIGDCTTGTPNVIRIAKNVFDVSTEDDRQELLYHELGHCFLGRDHTMVRIPGNLLNAPASIMFPYHFEGWMYRAHHDYYVEELFSLGQVCDLVGC